MDEASPVPFGNLLVLIAPRAEGRKSTGFKASDTLSWIPELRDLDGLLRTQWRGGGVRETEWVPCREDFRLELLGWPKGLQARIHDQDPGFPEACAAPERWEARAVGDRQVDAARTAVDCPLADDPARPRARPCSTVLLRLRPPAGRRRARSCSLLPSETDTRMRWDSWTAVGGGDQTGELTRLRRECSAGWTLKGQGARGVRRRLCSSWVISRGVTLSAVVGVRRAGRTASASTKQHTHTSRVPA